MAPNPSMLRTFELRLVVRRIGSRGEEFECERTMRQYAFGNKSLRRYVRKQLHLSGFEVVRYVSIAPLNPDPLATPVMSQAA